MKQVFLHAKKVRKEKKMNDELLKDPDAGIIYTAMQEEDFFGLLKDMSETDIWKECKGNEVRMMEKEGALLIELGSCGKYELFPQAISSVRRRAGVSGDVLEKLTSAEAACLLNICWPHAEGDVKALIRGGKLLALHSERFIPFQQFRLFDVFRAVLEDKYEKVKFEVAGYTHERSYAIFEVASARLLSGYKHAMSEAGFTACKDVRAFVELATSDAGLNSVMLHPTLSLNHNERVFITPPMTINHRDDATFEKIEAEMEGVFSLVDDGIKNLKRLLKIELTYPSSVAIKIAKGRKFNMPGKLIRALDTEFKIPEMMGLTMTAHSFYFTLCEMMDLEGFRKLTPRRQLAVKEMLAKIAQMSEAEWMKLDVNDVSW